MGYSTELQAKVERIVAGSGIASRKLVVPPDNFLSTLEAGRAAVWEEWAPRLAVAAARDALSRWPAGTEADVTHIVSHSCTGFAAPGIDFAVMRALGLPGSTRRIGVNFMGCFGAFTGLFVAKQIIEADTTGRAVVLVVCAETCSLHVSKDMRLELVVGNTLFADGGACAVVTHAGFRGARALSAPPAEEWALGAMTTAVVPDSAHAMTWKQGSISGQYDMWLDRSIPSALGGFFAGGGLRLLASVGIPSAWTCAWAIHPGGRAIIAAFEGALAALRITGDGLDASRTVLRDYGNMSSPTILFVLQRVLASTSARDVFFAGFGPGLTVEAGRLYRVGLGAGAVTQPVAASAKVVASAPVTAPPMRRRRGASASR